jgi:prepilin-type N-terminal cleavage/methylation domain-containing protein
VRRAFTLIELLVVVSIIGLLTAILLPSLPGATALYPAREFELLTTNRGFNTNYCQSWYMVHTQYDGTTSPVFNHDRMRGSIGPLRIAKMANAGASRVPLLGDARAAKNEQTGGGAQGYGSGVRETKSVTDGPGWQADENGSYTMAPYNSLTPYGIQDWDDFGPAHRPKRGLRNDEDHSLVVGNILFGDAHVGAFQDRYDFDNGRIKNRPDGELDSWDLRSSEVFDGVLTLGRRSRSARRLE